MPSRHGPGITDNRDPQAAIDMEVTATVNVIAGLRRRLRRPEILGHSKVRSELRKFVEQVGEQSLYVDHSPGRHRSTVRRTTSQQINDASGYDLKPNPLNANTPVEFVRVLNEYKQWSGDPSWRMMAKKANYRVVHSTMHSAMKSDALPNLNVLTAIIIGCDGDEEDLEMFVTAWRRIVQLHSHILDMLQDSELNADEVKRGQ